MGSTICRSLIRVGIHARPYLSRSLPVITAATPGTLSALDESMFLILACAYGLRTMSRCSIPGSLRSSMNLPRPRTSRGSSLRFIEWPRPLTSGILTSCRDGGRLVGAVHGCGRGLDRLDDVHVAGAAAQIAGDAPADFVFGGGGVALEQGDRGEHHAWRS